MSIIRAVYLIACLSEKLSILLFYLCLKGGLAMEGLHLREDLSIREVLAISTDYLKAHDIGEASENAKLLFLHISEWNSAALLMNMLEPFEEKWIEPFSNVIIRKANGEPYQYIIGEQYFYGRKFYVNEHVLIPRPETELLVEKIIELIKANFKDQPLTVVDVGTGSGAIALTLKTELPHLNVIASDISPAAIDVARRNAAALDVDLNFVEGDLLQPFVKGKELQYGGKAIDIVISNPPYIPDGDKDGLQIEVKQYEPHLALFGGVDGLTPYKKMLSTLEDIHTAPKVVAFELGIHQPAIVAKLMEAMHMWTTVEIVTDYNGIDRHIVAVRK